MAAGVSADGVSRRGRLRVGGLSAVGLPLPALPRAGAAPPPHAPGKLAADRGSTFGRARNRIFVWLQGGPPQREAFDPKPDAPADIRGPLRPTATVRFLLAAAVLGLVACRTPAADGPVFEPGAVLKVEAGGGVGGEGPAWDPELGVLTSGNGNIHRLSRDGTSSVYREKAGTNGLLFDREGRLLACEPGQRRVTRADRDGKLTVLTDRFAGKKYNTPNDLTIDSRNRVYFSDPRYGPRDGMEQTDPGGKTVEGVYRIDPDGQVTRVIGREVERANGVLVSADDKYLFVADNANDVVGGARKLWRFPLKADGAVDAAGGKALYDWGRGRGPDGLKQDARGRLYVAAGLNKPNPPAEPDAMVKAGIYVIDPEAGKLLAFQGVPTDEVTNCAFGGDDLKTLYVTGGGTLYSIRTTTPGRVVWPAKR
jgi:gluconolactonase